MKIVFTDGTEMECKKIQVYPKFLFVDEYRTVDIDDVLEIVEV